METQTLTPATHATTKNHKDLATELKKECEKNKCFNDVCTVFALRERARAQVTVNSLKAAMDAKKYIYSKEDYKDVLSRMARLGLGTLHKDNKGRVRALVNVKYTLQSIGLTAVGDKLNLAPFSKTKRFSKLPVAEAIKSPTQIREQFAKIAERRKTPSNPTDKTILMGKINGQAINIPLTDEQFTQFLSQLVKQ